MWRGLYHDYYLFVVGVFFALIFAKKQKNKFGIKAITKPIRELCALKSWEDPCHRKGVVNAVNVNAVSISIGIALLLMFPSFAKAEKVFSSDPPIRVEIVWPPEGNYCLLPANPGIPCVIKVVDYDAFSVPNIRNLTITNFEETGSAVLQAYWRVEPKEAGSFVGRNYNGTRITFVPNPNYNNGQGGPAKLISVVVDTDRDTARRDRSITIQRTITLIPKPAIHAIQIEVVRASDPTRVIHWIPFTSGQSDLNKVKWRLIGVRPLPSSFGIIAESWSVQGIGVFNGNPVLTNIISHNQEHRNVTITYTFTWENSLTGEQETDIKSINVLICFHRSDFDEWKGSPKGYMDKFGHYHEPPNWFDDRPNHWLTAINELGSIHVYYRHSDPEDNPWCGIIHFGRFDWNGTLDPVGQNRVEYHGRIYVYSCAAALISSEHHGYRPTVITIGASLEAEISN